MRDKQLSITCLQHDITWRRNLREFISKGNKSENIIYVWRLLDTYSSLSIKFAKVEKWAIYRAKIYKVEPNVLDTKLLSG